VCSRSNTLRISVRQRAHFSTAFPGAQVTIEEMLGEGDLLACRCTMRALHSGPMGPIPPSNQNVTLPYIVIARVKGGKFHEVWEHFDTYGLMKAIGALPKTVVQ
jgi:predicted ester cyclase